jgi:hypothetical protein
MTGRAGEACACGERKLNRSGCQLVGGERTSDGTRFRYTPLAGVQPGKLKP